MSETLSQEFITSNYLLIFFFFFFSFLINAGALIFVFLFKYAKQKSSLEKAPQSTRQLNKQ